MTYSKNKLLELYSDADFYDYEFSERHHEIKFYVDILANKKSVLEVACGTGRLTIPIHKSGAPIKGTDISISMIDKARKNSEEQCVDIDFQVEDAVNITGTYDCIFIATNAFQHFIDFNEAEKFLKVCKNSLTDNGLLIVDLQIPNIKKLTRSSNDIKEYKSFYIGEREVKANIQGDYIKLTQIL